MSLMLLPTEMHLELLSTLDHESLINLTSTNQYFRSLRHRSARQISTAPSRARVAGKNGSASRKSAVNLIVTLLKMNSKAWIPSTRVSALLLLSQVA
ncbi:hypothetical protein GJ744_009059 [Endocarpon pusillum]|uniref:F-box domain-containing protein n=1 Tax=Endocarpon pusillum TaxID=364733 RepID=A0A8H7AIQ9_9EURO|nr:hypothetical protein GJ744_009059 [Endocarpon pusillum]